jgi:hypothetical protein
LGRTTRFNYKHSQETIEKIRIANTGNIAWNKGRKGLDHPTPETLLKMSKASTGRIFSAEARRKISLAHSGKKCHFWKGGITPVNLMLRTSTKYKEWRKKVYERDNYTCQHCGSAGKGNLEAHHIKRFSEYPELRFSVENGLTLCEDCHRKTDNYSRKGTSKKCVLYKNN